MTGVLPRVASQENEVVHCGIKLKYDVAVVVVRVVGREDKILCHGVEFFNTIL